MLNLLKSNLIKIFSPQFCWWCFEARKNDYLCQEHLNKISLLLCPICHKRYPEIKIITSTCQNCRSKTFLDGLFVIFKLEEPLQKLIYGYKYDLYFQFGKTLAKLLEENLPLQFKDLIFVPIPSFEKKINERGFNHIEYILKNTSLKFKSYLKKIKNTLPQAKLTNIIERQKNVADCFALKQKPEEKILVLFDDIKTTGFTLNEAAKVLKQNGVKKVFGLTLACKI